MAPSPFRGLHHERAIFYAEFVYQKQRNHSIKLLFAALDNLQKGYPLIARDSMLLAIRNLELLMPDSIHDYSSLKIPAIHKHNNNTSIIPLPTARLISYAIKELHCNHGEYAACSYISTAIDQINDALTEPGSIKPYSDTAIKTKAHSA